MPRIQRNVINAFILLVCATLLAQTLNTPFAPRAAAAEATAETHAPFAPPSAPRADSKRAAEAYGGLPLNFEVNRGQADPRARFLSRGPGYTLRLTQGAATLRLRGRDGTRAATLRMSFVGADLKVAPEGLEASETKSNYLIGRDPRAWLTNIENYKRVAYKGLYPGVDLLFYGSGGRLEYDFALAAGADPGRLKLRFEGSARPRLDADGSLVLRTAAGEVRQLKPVAYQFAGGRKNAVACEYVLGRSGAVGFRLGNYDHGAPLVIDPVLSYSTLLGGSLSENIQDMAVDAAGNAYVTGSTDSTNFPVSADARQKTYAGPAPGTDPFDGDAFVSKLDPSGQSLVYSTYVGGAGGDGGMAIAIDAAGNAYVAGDTFSADFPTSADAFDKTCGAGGTCDDDASAPGPELDAFVFKLNQTGSALVYSTYLGGSGAEPLETPVTFTFKLGIAVDSSGSAYVTGPTTSQDFPTTAGAFQTTPGPSFVTKLNPAGTALVYSTYFPGGTTTAVAVDSAGDAHITGATNTSDGSAPTLPVVNAYQPTLGGAGTLDAFAAKLNPAGTALLFSTFLGGRNAPGDPVDFGHDAGQDIALDSTGNVYVAGTTASGCFPSGNPYAPAPDNVCLGGGSPREFVAKLSPTGNTLLFSNVLKRTGAAQGELSVTADGFSSVAYICQSATSFAPDVCADRVSPEGQHLYTGVLGGGSFDFIGGVADGADGTVYVAGWTRSSDFPTTPGALRQTRSGASDAFVTKLATSLAEVSVGTSGQSVSEGAGKTTLHVTRSGNLALDFSLDYATEGFTATSVRDFTYAAGTLHFAPGETDKEINVFITDDVYQESTETFNVRFTNLPLTVTFLSGGTSVQILDNDATTGSNPVVPPGFNSTFFVRQHYIDFLNREPDPDGLAFWKSEIDQCGTDAQCAEVKRVNVSAAFFLSIEFQETGYLVYRIYKAAYGDATSPNVAGTVPVIRLNEFLPDTQRIGQGVIVNVGNWQQQLETNKNNYALEFVRRQRFLDAFPVSLTPTEFVNRLDLNAGGVLSASERTSLVNELTANNTDAGRASVLRKVAEDADLRQREFNRAFVLMEYFGYLRRNPDDAPDGDFRGWRFWLDKLEQFGGNYVAAEMVKAFIQSDEYKFRFGP